MVRSWGAGSGRGEPEDERPGRRGGQPVLGRQGTLVHQPGDTVNRWGVERRSPGPRGRREGAELPPHGSVAFGRRRRKTVSGYKS